MCLKILLKEIQILIFLISPSLDSFINLIFDYDYELFNLLFTFIINVVCKHNIIIRPGLNYLGFLY